jgi:cation diffusion facilitator CzcD-associated flavoprotein CzcO
MKITYLPEPLTTIGEGDFDPESSTFDVQTSISMQQNNIVIIGSGFGGIAAAARLKALKENDFVVLERSTEVGGVWRDNHYPGCACDVQSHLYSLSFAPNHRWTSEFSRQAEIHAYLKNLALDTGVVAHIHFSTEVTRMTWDEDAGKWLIETTKGTYLARYVIGATGALSNPHIPEIPGLATYRGQTFHSATWPHHFDPVGKRVAVVGTGASAIQFIPAIQPDVAQMHLFQRTPPWVMPRHDAHISAKRRALYCRYPSIMKLTRLRLYAQRELTVLAFQHPAIMKIAQRTAMKHLRRQIADPELRRKLTPSYTMGCKRILLSDTYYPAVASSNVEVVTSGIKCLTPRGIVGNDGIERTVDVVIFGSGFKVNDPPFAHLIFGKHGQSLARSWAGHPQSVDGTTVNGFPNLFLLHGPNTGLGHTSVIYMLEAQIDHLLSAMHHAKIRHATIIEARMEAQQRFTLWLESKVRNTVWTTGGCTSWYLDSAGRNSFLWPGYSFSFRQRVAKIRQRDYEVRG